MREMRDNFESVARVIWKRLREWCGDAAYEKYRRSILKKGGARLLSPAQFYVQQQERKYSRPSRCC